MDEAEFLKRYDPALFARPAVTVDLVLLSIRDGGPCVLLMQREEPPCAGAWALPGGFVAIDEALEEAAARLLAERAGAARARLEQLYTFGAPDRDPRMRIVTVAYLALMPEDALTAALSREPRLRASRLAVPWPGERGSPVAALSPSGAPLALAFDHADILALAMLRLRGKLDYSEVGFALLPERFTLRQLQDVHESILGTRLNKPAFRRRMLERGWLEATGRREAGTSFRPAELYRYARPA